MESGTTQATTIVVAGSINEVLPMLTQAASAALAW
jgi:hypothetical protein